MSANFDHVLKMCGTIGGCAKAQPGCENKDSCEFDCPSGMTCGTGRGQYNRVFKRTYFAIAPGSTYSVDLAAYDQGDGSTNSMTSGRKVLVCNKTSTQCHSASVDIAGPGFNGSADPGGTFLHDKSINGFPAGIVTLTNSGTDTAKICVFILGVNDA